MRYILAQRRDHSVRQMVVHIVLRAKLLHNRVDLAKVAVIYRREQMMFNLEIQSSRQQEDEC